MHGSTDGVWAEDARLPHEILDSLRDLNLRFLELLRAGCGSAYRRPPPGELTRAQLEALARCPYALFDLNFADAVHWQLRLDRARHWQVADEARPEAGAVEFTRLALFFAWHAVRVHGVSAQLTLGLPPTTVEAFRAVSLDRLPALAPGASQLLAPRWQDCGTFWSALFRAATSRDPSRLERVQLYGVQLAACARLKAPPPA